MATQPYHVEFIVVGIAAGGRVRMISSAVRRAVARKAEGVRSHRGKA